MNLSSSGLHISHLLRGIGAWYFRTRIFELAELPRTHKSTRAIFEKYGDLGFYWVSRINVSSIGLYPAIYGRDVSASSDVATVLSPPAAFPENVYDESQAEPSDFDQSTDVASTVGRPKRARRKAPPKEFRVAWSFATTGERPKRASQMPADGFTGCMGRGGGGHCEGSSAYKPTS